MLVFREITCRIAGRTLLEGASATLPDGYRVGLVGRNGTGKSTLLKVICGEIPLEAGSVEMPERTRIAKLPQEPPGGSQTPLDYVLAADTERAALLAEAETATEPERVAAIHLRLADIQAHTAPARVAVILAGLGFDEPAQNRPLDSFSGGWRMRVALAATLFVQPDLLLLDEPTNHLDLEAALWLEGFVRSYPRTVLLVSHDRHFLNNAVEHILHIDHGKLVLYRGNYDSFEGERRANLTRQAAMAARQEAVRKDMEAFIARFRAKASKAAQAQSRMKMLAKMQPIAAALEDPTVVFKLPEPEELSPPIITLDNLAVGYQPDQPVLKNLNLRIDMDDRIAFLGANGNGKSTLAKLLAGELKPQSGKLFKSGKLRIGYFAQDQDDVLDPARTPMEHLQELMPQMPPLQVRARLGGFGLTQSKAATPAGSLSGGERARLLFAMVTHHKPHLLILDEPTNHLDMDTRDALVQALNEYSGAVLLVSHDRHLAEACVDRFWLVADGTVTPYDGDLDDYAKWLADRRRNAAGRDRKGADMSKADRKAERQKAAAARAALAPLRKTAQDAEKRLEKLNGELSRLEAAMGDPQAHEKLQPQALIELQKQHADLARRITATEADWLEASARLEAAEAEAS